MTSLAVCDDCGGPAFWTFIDGHPHYHCKQLCSGFTQTELDIPGSVPYVDRVVSVSALPETETDAAYVPNHNELFLDEGDPQ